ncbi:queuine tRNA-ribosyltransferase accessory subunit 2 [Teleopsis dalmanni]|uniref:queuine tRNA-ribosyltransferase accessory subunit 2 n=1 Tax=Teleopsis dalmanni TaxID=139649 RepID=UPI0018CFA48A|nr:queuine tRNA-ribosyltransferase accessory subunit 2 [Teleopsis dalmanni]
MKFVVGNISKSSGRLGCLVFNENGHKFKTPLLLQTTKGGSIPYLSREVFDYVSKDVHVLQMSLANTDSMAESLKLFKDSVSAYVGYKHYPVLLMIRDPCEITPSGFNDKDMVPLYTRRGKEALTATRYMELVQSFAPDLFTGLSDADTNFSSGKKRVQKSVDRTEQFMEDCYKKHSDALNLQSCTVLAPIVGGYNTYARTQSIKHAHMNGKNIVGGYLLEGFHNNGLTATEIPTVELLKVVTHCIKEMDADKPKLMSGAYTPLVILELIRLGVDIFDTSYACLAAANYKALAFNYNFDNVKDLSSAFVDITDESIKEDFTPLISNCDCLACQKHTRAYIHHLYKTRELLCSILLMIHNLHHYIQYFETIRTCIANDNLADLINLIKYQNSDHEIDYIILENVKTIAAKGFTLNSNDI